MILPHDLLSNPETAGIFAALPRTTRIVDVGCGIRPCPAFPAEHICIEPHGEYVDLLSGWTVIQGEVEKVADQPRADTTVLLLDVVEHLERDRGERIVRLLEEFEHAVIFTPLGWYEQPEETPDCWGLNGGVWQKHRSAWSPADFEKWNVKSWPHWHPKNGVGAILAIR